jgi:phage terminase large subunit-like protein
VWWDEFAACRKLDESWDMVQFGLRLGDPKMVLTTTPKRRPKLREVIDMAGTVTVKARTDDNPALPEARRMLLYERYGGTTIGRQELDAEILDDVAGALWRRSMIELLRVSEAPPLTRIVVAIDPSATSTESADECGITVEGTSAMGHQYVLEDLSLRASPSDWARVAIDAYHRHSADRIIAETNNGGEMVEAVIRSIDPSVPYRSVTASRGKQTRAEPISALYEQGKVHHVGAFELLEDQMCQWMPGEKSPDRMDSLVWGLTELTMGTSWSGQSVSAIA